MAHPNEDLLRRGYTAFAEGDMDTLDEVVADDVAWHEAGDHPLSGDREGKDEVFAFFREINERSGGTFRIDLHDVLATDEHVVALAVEHGERGDKRLDRALEVHVFHVEDGRVTEFWGCPFDASTLNEFWS